MNFAPCHGGRLFLKESSLQSVRDHNPVWLNFSQIATPKSMAEDSEHLERGIRATTLSTESCSRILTSCSLPLKQQLIERDHIYHLGKLTTHSYLGKLKRSGSPLANQRQGILSFWGWWGC